MRLAFAGANPAVVPMAEDPLPVVANYFLGNDPAQWHTNVPTSARVRYPGLYPGVDLVVYGTQSGGLEYDVVVAPGADPAAFALAIGGAERVTVEAESGALVLGTAAGEVRQHAPVLYQERGGVRQAVDGGYALREDGTVGFVVGAYDATLPLVIDPALLYSTYLGGSSVDFGNGIAVDTSGNAYVTGYTLSTNFPTVGAVQPAYRGTYDAFVTKLNASSNALLYSTYLGGSIGDEGLGIAVDASGNAYVTGGTGSTNFPTVGAFQPTFGGGGQDAFVAKIGLPSTTTLMSSGATTYGQSITFTATVSGSDGTPTGTVTFSRGGMTLGSGAVALMGTTSMLVVTTLPAGVDTLTATYGGDTNYSGSMGTTTVTITTPLGVSALTGTGSNNRGTATLPVIVPGATVQLVLSGSNTSGVTYTSANANVAIVNPTTGAVTGIAPGMVVITVSGPGGTATITVTVATIGTGGLTNPNPAPGVHAGGGTTGASPAAQPVAHPTNGNGVQPQAADTSTPGAQPTRY